MTYFISKTPQSFNLYKKNNDDPSLSQTPLISLPYFFIQLNNGFQYFSQGYLYYSLNDYKCYIDDFLSLLHQFLSQNNSSLIFQNGLFSDQPIIFSTLLSTPYEDYINKLKYNNFPFQNYPTKDDYFTYNHHKQQQQPQQQHIQQQHTTQQPLPPPPSPIFTR